MESRRNEMKNEVRIGGWLILVLIGLIITPIRLGITLFSDFFPMLDSMSLLDAYPSLQIMIYTEGIGNIIFGISAIILLIIMSNKDRRFPKLMIAFYVANLIFVLVDAIYATQIPVIEQFVSSEDSLKEVVRAIIGTAIWVPYMMVSTRVKRTFVK